MEKQIATITKSSREEVRVMLSDSEGPRMIFVRTFFEDASGEYVPSRNGLALKLELLPALAIALAEAEAAACLWRAEAA